jgi:hypothetical protein
MNTALRGLSDEAAAGEVANEGLVDRRSLEHEVVEVLGERRLRGGDLILDRPRLLLKRSRRAGGRRAVKPAQTA